jgi:hypothetical protein
MIIFCQKVIIDHDARGYTVDEKFEQVASSVVSYLVMKHCTHSSGLFSKRYYDGKEVAISHTSLLDVIS